MVHGNVNIFSLLSNIELTLKTRNYRVELYFIHCVSLS